MARSRLDPHVRKENIIVSAMAVTRKLGLSKVTREAIAKHAGVADGTVSHYYHTMTQLRRAVTRRAMADGDAKILSMMLADPTYKRALKPEHRELAIAHLQG